VSLVVLAVVLVACVVAAGVLRAGTRASERARAEAAADAAALAAADQLALGATRRRVCATASAVAHDNAATVTSCRIGSAWVEVAVAVAERAGRGVLLAARSRAVVDP
jgi:secretion/DNA translocation related TadE-like protein